MKKNVFFAALILGFSGTAQAASSVTLYGVLDNGMAYQQVEGNTSYARNRGHASNFKQTKTGLMSGASTSQKGSRWGIKGVEDLGDGLRVVFQLEGGFNPGYGESGQSGRLFGRKATVGLAGDSWGQLDLGRQTNMASRYLPGIADPFDGSYGQARMGGSFSAANTVRWDNAIVYQSPDFSGVQFGVGYSFNVNGEQGYTLDTYDNNPNQRAITTAVRYVNGPIGVALTYDQAKAAFSTGPDAVLNPRFNQTATKRSWGLGASYDFTVVKVHAAYGQTRNGLFSTRGYGDLGYTQNFGTDAAPVVGNLNGDGLKVNSYALGLSAPIANGTLMASWQMADARSASDSFNAAALSSGVDIELEKQHIYSLGYSYTLSKRTSLYVVGSYGKNVTFRPDATSRILGAGLTHQF